MSLSTMLCNLRLDSCVFDPFKVDEGSVLTEEGAGPAQKQECAAMSTTEAVIPVQYYFEDDPVTVIEGSLLDPNGEDLTKVTCIECRFYSNEESLLSHGSFVCTRRGECLMSCDEARICSYFKRKDAHENNG
ncbi:hypothetical protein [Fundidesulfovibrio agrisoli]|uniref:hypothetical protein n=1 Tax=Fundidesulfovibrio agrisoli TaxID=2922717 RepID=UPI001FADEDF7|nr:hypothetical protein [Fundidesulfovibrio agrisoli]